ncbi:hypothetical protein RR46_12617 [Papilio xuthus]|uniref:Uncharacterized protein n=1 Tax=Papilio xuthus TaxID=66420 RepID=A0A194PTF3_PAPXU|nr:hypothetical protein RR46_12617 [Papilio xuthus]
MSRIKLKIFMCDVICMNLNVLHAFYGLGAASSSGAVKAVSLSDVTTHITPTSVTSPVSTAAKVTQISTKTTLEPDVAFPAVLKGSQKQRVPPPVPPRGSPKAKRGGHSQSGHEPKGDYSTLNVSANDNPLKRIASSDDDFGFYGHDVKFKEFSACRVATSMSNYSDRIPKLGGSNDYLNYVEDEDIVTNRTNSGKDLVAQRNMMAKFNIDKVVREHLDTGDYDGISFTESSDEESIIAVEVNDYGDDSDEKVTSSSPKVTSKSKNPLHFIIRQKKQPKKEIKSTPKIVKNSSSDSSPDIVQQRPVSKPLIKTIPLKKAPEKNIDNDVDASKSSSKPGLMYGLSKKFNFNQSKKEKPRDKEPQKIKPKIEIRTYSEEHSEGVTKDVVFGTKAKSKIDMFQKNIKEMQADDNEPGYTPSAATAKPRRPPTIRRRDKVSETKKIFEKPPAPKPPIFKDPKPNISNIANEKPIAPKPFSGNVHDKIRKFTVVPVPEPKTYPKPPAPKLRQSFKRKPERNKFMVVTKDVEEYV